MAQNTYVSAEAHSPKNYISKLFVAIEATKVICTVYTSSPPHRRDVKEEMFFFSTTSNDLIQVPLLIKLWSDDLSDLGKCMLSCVSSIIQLYKSESILCIVVLRVTQTAVCCTNANDILLISLELFNVHISLWRWHASFCTFINTLYLVCDSAIQIEFCNRVCQLIVYFHFPCGFMKKITFLLLSIPQQ